MEKDFYEFDPCALDGSDVDEYGTEYENTLDTWKPTIKKPTIVQSAWRKEQIGNDFNQQPSIDDLRKIQMYLKKDVSDAEVMKVFGITAETIVAIKKDKYCPVDGIKLDNLSKIYKHFDYLEKKIHYLTRANNYISKLLFIDDISMKKFINYCEKKPTEKSEWQNKDGHDY